MIKKLKVSLCLDSKLTLRVTSYFVHPLLYCINCDIKKKKKILFIVLS